MDTLTAELDEFRDNKQKHPAVRIAAARGLALMNKYYSLTDDSSVFRVAMSKLIPYHLLSHRAYCFFCISASS